MYAIIKTGGKQYRVTEGQTVKIEKLSADVDQKVEFDQVLMVAGETDTQVGAPTVAGAKVTATVVEQGRHKKINIIKFKRRKHYDRQAGHRQYYTAVKIDSIAA